MGLKQKSWGKTPFVLLTALSVMTTIGAGATPNAMATSNGATNGDPNGTANGVPRFVSDGTQNRASHGVNNGTKPSQSESQGSTPHVVYIIMDNVHYSDIAQMPHVMQFLQQGTTFKNDHTILSSHTQDGMLSDMTGQYPSQTGVPNQDFYEGNGRFASFAYWTNKDPDGQPHVTTTPNWTEFNRHGLSVGAIGTPDMELEKPSEVSPQMMTAADQNPKDYLGVALHKADGTTVFGAPNLPYIYNASAWANPGFVLGAFPGWGEADPNWALQSTYEMQTNGVPVTFTYLHDVHEVNGQQMGPGKYGSVIQMYDQAFATFFTKLNAAGLNSRNTLFVITTDEGDQYMPSGELSANLTGLLGNNSLHNTPASNLDVVGDSGALVYLHDTTTLPQTLSSLMAIPGWNYIADTAALQAVHMAPIQAPDRTPSFVLFSKPDVWYNYSGTTDWQNNPKYVWNHGTISPAILDIWMGMVGPGVKAKNTSTQWIDHADTLPTLYKLLGYSLTDTAFDGVPAISALSAVNDLHGQNSAHLAAAENLFKQLNAPVGEFGMDMLNISTEAAVNATNSVGTTLDQQILLLTKQRDAIAKSLQQDIEATLAGHPVSEATWSRDMNGANSLLQTAGTVLQ